MAGVTRSVLIALLVLGGAAFAHAAEDAPLERGAAIIDPLALRALDAGRFGLAHMLVPTHSVNAPLSNSELFALPSMARLRKSLDEDFERYIARHEADLPGETIGVGSSFDLQLFDRTALDSADTRFVLSGIVNRMDRAYVAPDTCGEIARRWLATADLKLTGAELAARLTGKGGALELIAPQNILRIETNMQIAHVPKSAVRDFLTDYLMKVFDYNAQSKSFEETPLENQIDRERLLADKDLRREFKAWLL